MINNVLCVDDDDIAQFYTSAVIEDAPFINNADSAYDGKGALIYLEGLLNEKQNDRYPELILLDLNMPIMDGWEFLQEFYLKYASTFNLVKVAIVSSSVNPADFVKAKDFPFVIDFISKPITVEILENINKNYFQ